MSESISTSASITETATIPLIGRRTLAQASGKHRNTTSRQYRLAWADFASFLLRSDTAPWPRAMPKSEIPTLLSSLDALIPGVTAKSIEAYKAALLNVSREDGSVGLSAATIELRLSALSYIMKRSIDEGLRKDNPCDAVSAPKRVRKGKVALTLDQVTRLLKELQNKSGVAERDHRLIFALASTGMRREEAAELRYQDLEDSEEGLLITIQHGKGDKPRVILATLDLEEVMGRGEKSHFLFPALVWNQKLQESIPDPTRSLTPDHVTKICRQRTAEITGTAFGPHTFRHFFITQALNSGAPLHEVQAYVGHSSPNTTMGYFHGTISRKRSAAEFVSLRKEES